MSKKFHPKDKLLQELVSGFEQSVKDQTNAFFQEEDLEKIIEYYESVPNFKHALLAAERALELFPYSGNCYIKTAQIYYHLKNYELAWQMIEQAMVYDAQSTELLLLKVDLLSAEEYYDEAIDILHQLINVVQPYERVDVMLEIADIYDMANQPKKLGLALKKVLKSNPLNEEALHRFWNYVIDQNIHEQGIYFFNELIELKPYNFLAWYYAAKCYEEVSLLEKAVEYYEYSLAINDYYFAHWDYGYCLQDLKLWDKAISNYNEMITLFDQETSIYLELANCEKEKGNYDIAIAKLIEAKEGTNDRQKQAKCEYLIASIYLKTKDNIAAINHYQKAIKLRSNKPKYWNALATAYLNNNRIEDASNCLKQSLQKKEDQPKQWIKLARCYHQLGNQNLLFETLHTAHSILPTHVKLSYTYAAYLLHYGFNQTGLMQLAHALSLDSTKKKFIFTLFPELLDRKDVNQLCN